MTEHIEFTTNDEAINMILNNGLAEGLPRVAEMLLNAAMLIERATHLQAKPHQRTEERTGHSNGFKPRSLHTGVGGLDLRVPQVRGCEEPFRPSLFEKGCRVERSLKVAIAEMYIQGVSTRRVTTVMKKLCGLEISSTQVSRLTAELDAEFEKWRTRPLPEIAFLVIDALYIKVRLDGAVRDCAVLIANGVCRDTGKRMILGVSAAISEAEVHWRSFLTSLKERGIGIPDLVTSDAHEGIKAALRATLSSTPWQRCQFHLQQNAQAYVTNQSMRREVAEDIRSVFNSPDLPAAEERLARIVAKYEQSAPKLSAWMEQNIPQGLNIFAQPECCRKRLRTSNMNERLNREIRRRTRVVGLFPNEDSVLRLVTAILMEISEEWETGRKYISPENDKN